MNRQIISAVFDNQAEAERAVNELRSAGARESAISIISRHEDGGARTTDASGREHEHADNKGSGIAKGVGVGAGVGALFGLAAIAIPGIGPFVAAGALAETLGAAGSAVASGAIIGGTAGGLSGALMDYGVSEEDAGYYEERINRGGVFVSLDAKDAGIDAEEAREILYRAGGHSASRARTEAM